MAKLIKSFAASGWGAWLARESSDPVTVTGSSAKSPAVETFSKDGQQILRLDLPGVKPKEVDVSVVDDTLIIRGERKNANEIKEKDRYYKETAYGKFERRLALPKGVDGKKVKATYRNGVLEVSVPAPSKLVGTSIPIQIEHSAA